MPRCFLAALLLPVFLAAQPPPYSVPPPDAPALSAWGSYHVGVRTLELVNKDQIDILKLDRKTGKAPTADRHLTVEVWYPASVSAGVAEATEYVAAAAWPVAPGQPATFKIPGRAVRNAAPVRTAEKFPLVIVSHGYPGSRYFLTYLTENLASKGYIVAAIDHTDSVWGAIRPFPSTLYNRSTDQIFTITEITRQAAEPASFLHNLLDATRVAVIGYSMGGYGAVTTAGAGYGDSTALLGQVPQPLLAPLQAGSKEFEARRLPQLKAMVAIAPWGAQPPFSVWSAEGLAGIHIPSLIIAGDQDDVSNFSGGIKRIFDQSIHSDRCLLVYENARHNVGGNPAPREAQGSYDRLEFFEEPVWRKERITAINDHFITAFLDLYLKGDESKRAYLHPAVEKSNDGEWTAPPGKSTDGQFSTGNADDHQTVWKGFQRRWAVGLELHCQAAK